MTANEFQANIKLIGFSYDISAFTYTNENYITIYIFPNLQAVRLDDYAEQRSLFMRLDGHNIMQRLIRFIEPESEILVYKKQ